MHSKSPVKLNPYVSAEIAPDGSFVIPNVPAGPAEVRLQRGWGDDAAVIAKKELTIARRQEIVLDLP